MGYLILSDQRGSSPRIITISMIRAVYLIQLSPLWFLPFSGMRVPGVKLPFKPLVGTTLVTNNGTDDSYYSNYGFHHNDYHDSFKNSTRGKI